MLMVDRFGDGKWTGGGFRPSKSLPQSPFEHRRLMTSHTKFFRTGFLHYQFSVDGKLEVVLLTS